MRPGFMIYSLGRALSDGTLTVPDALKLMKELGAEGVDITAWHVADYSLAEARQMVADAGLVVSCYIDGANVLAEDPAERGAAMDKLRRIIDETAEIGCKTALLITGDCKTREERAAGRRQTAEALAELLPQARANGVTLTFEDRGSLLCPYQTGAECLEVCELAGPEMMLTYDTGNMIPSGEDPVTFFEVARSRVAHVHVKDWALLPPEATQGLASLSGRRYQGAIIGQGVLDYPRIFAALKAADYKGFVSFEYEGGGDPIQAAREGMAYLHRLME